MTDPGMDADARAPASPGPAADAGMYLTPLTPLLHHICAGWPRRGRKLLEVGCGDGRILELFWTLGFDVTGVEADPRALEQARARLGDRGECVPGSCGHLPFADESFDYVALVSLFNRAADAPRSGLPAIFAEAGRVATRQIVIVFPNAWSLHWLECLLRRNPARFYNPVAMWRRLRRACPQGHAHWCSLPVGPLSSWQKKRFWPHCNRWRMPVPLGAFAGLHLDLLPATPVTGLPLRVASRLSLAETSPIAPCGATPERD